MMRRGFGLITAIIILVTVATLMTLMMGLSSSSVKSTIDLYLKEQAEILARSGTEFALLAISGHDNRFSCVENINIGYPTSSATTRTHDINITLQYIGTDLNCNAGRTLADPIATDESNLTVIIDTVVSVHQVNTGITEPIRFHRRTIQKP